MLFKVKRLDEKQSGFLNFIRGGAAILVLIAHCQQIFISPYWYPHKELEVALPLVLYRHLGSIGVILFFVLSGFLIYCSIANNLSANREFKFDVVSFFVSRLVRLWPPLIVATLVSLLSYLVIWHLDLSSAEEFNTGKEIYLARETLLVNWKDIFGSLIFINTIVEGYGTPSINGPLWSLAHEFWFYVLAASLILFYVNSRNLWFLAFAFGFLYVNVNDFFWYGFSVWLAGFTSAWFWSNWHLKCVRVACLAIAVVFLISWIYALNESQSSFFFNNRHKFIFGLSFAFLMPVIMSNVSFLEVIKKSKICTMVKDVAAYAYTLYLIHFPIMLLLFVTTNRLVNGNPIFLMIQVFLALGLIIMLSRWIAKIVENKSKLERLKDKLIGIWGRLILRE